MTRRRLGPIQKGRGSIGASGNLVQRICGLAMVEACFHFLRVRGCAKALRPSPADRHGCRIVQRGLAPTGRVLRSQGIDRPACQGDDDPKQRGVKAKRRETAAPYPRWQALCAGGPTRTGSRCQGSKTAAANAGRIGKTRQRTDQGRAEPAGAMAWPRGGGMPGVAAQPGQDWSASHTGQWTTPRRQHHQV